MANYTKQPAAFAKTLSGAPPFSLSYPEEANQTFKKGQFVVRTANGYVATANATSNVVTGIGNCLLGMAAEDGHNNATAGAVACEILIADGHTVFSITKCSNAGGNANIAYNDVGWPAGFQIWQDTANGIDAAHIGPVASANAKLSCVNLDAGYAANDQNGRLWVQILTRFRQLGATS